MKINAIVCVCVCGKLKRTQKTHWRSFGRKSRIKNCLLLGRLLHIQLWGIRWEILKCTTDCYNGRLYLGCVPFGYKFNSNNCFLSSGVARAERRIHAYKRANLSQCIYFDSFRWIQSGKWKKQIKAVPLTFTFTHTYTSTQNHLRSCLSRATVLKHSEVETKTVSKMKKLKGKWKWNWSWKRKAASKAELKNLQLLRGLAINYHLCVNLWDSRWLHRAAMPHVWV